MLSLENTTNQRHARLVSTIFGANSVLDYHISKNPDFYGGLPTLHKAGAASLLSVASVRAVLHRTRAACCLGLGLPTRIFPDGLKNQSTLACDIHY